MAETHVDDDLGVYLAPSAEDVLSCHHAESDEQTSTVPVVVYREHYLGLGKHLDLARGSFRLIPGSQPQPPMIITRYAAAVDSSRVPDRFSPSLLSVYLEEDFGELKEAITHPTPHLTRADSNSSTSSSSPPPPPQDYPPTLLGEDSGDWIDSTQQPRKQGGPQRRGSSTSTAASTVSIVMDSVLGPMAFNNDDDDDELSDQNIASRKKKALATPYPSLVAESVSEDYDEDCVLLLAGGAELRAARAPTAVRVAIVDVESDEDQYSEEEFELPTEFPCMSLVDPMLADDGDDADDAMVLTADPADENDVTIFPAADQDQEEVEALPFVDVDASLQPLSLAESELSLASPQQHSTAVALTLSQQQPTSSLRSPDDSGEVSGSGMVVDSGEPTSSVDQPLTETTTTTAAAAAAAAAMEEAVLPFEMLDDPSVATATPYSEADRRSHMRKRRLTIKNLLPAEGTEVAASVRPPPISHRDSLRMMLDDGDSSLTATAAEEPSMTPLLPPARRRSASGSSSSEDSSDDEGKEDLIDLVKAMRMAAQRGDDDDINAIVTEAFEATAGVKLGPCPPGTERIMLGDGPLGVSVVSSDVGIVVSEVSPGSLGFDNGIKVGDGIIELNGFELGPFTTAETFVSKVRNLARPLLFGVCPEMGVSLLEAHHDAAERLKASDSSSDDDDDDDDNDDDSSSADSSDGSSEDDDDGPLEPQRDILDGFGIETVSGDVDLYTFVPVEYVSALNQLFPAFMFKDLRHLRRHHSEELEEFIPENEIPKFMALGLVAFLIHHNIGYSTVLSSVHGLGAGAVDDLLYLLPEEIEALEITREQRDILLKALQGLRSTADLEEVD